MKRLIIMLVAITAAVCLMSGCQMYGYDYRDDVLEYAMITDSDDLSALDEYPNLEYVDLRGSTCYDAIIAYSQDHPDVTVRYNVTIGEKHFDTDDASISVDGSDTTFDQLLQNLQYLPNLKTVHINQLQFTKDQLDNLTVSYPDITFTYTVELLGRRFDDTTTEINLPELTTDGIDDAIRVFSLLPQLSQVKLTADISENRLNMADVKRLNDACPGILFDYKFFLFDQQISTMDTSILFDSVEIGNSGVNELRSALAIMEQCTSVKLDSCGIDNDIADQLRSEFPDMNVAWRVFPGRFSMMTDEEMIRMQFTLTNEQAEVLKYCTKVKYLDLFGSKVTHIDFANYMPALECVVLTQSKVQDISPLAGCENLIWLEISSCYEVKELSAISGLKNLKYLNISNTSIKDIESLKNLPLERFCCYRSSVKNNILDEFINQHPDCLTTSTGSALNYGWRYNDKQLKEPFEYYAHMQEVFRYNERGYTGNRKE